MTQIALHKSIYGTSLHRKEKSGRRLIQLELAYKKATVGLK